MNWKERKGIFEVFKKKNVLYTYYMRNILYCNSNSRYTENKIYSI